MKYWDFERANPPGRGTELFKQLLFCAAVLTVVVQLALLLRLEWVRDTWLYAGLFFAGFVWLLVAQVQWRACALMYGAIAKHTEYSERFYNLLAAMPHFKSRVLSPDGTIRDDAADLWVDDLLVEVPGWARAAMDVLPPLFTAVGILFTFIGLSEGLSSVNLVFDGATEGSATDESRRLLNDMQGLLSGIKTAFHSSIFGVLLSGFALYTSRRLSTMLEDRAAALRDAFGATIETSQRQLLVQSNAILTEMRELSKENASKLGQLVSDLPGNISRALAPSFQHLEGSLVPGLEKISNSITGLAESAVDAQQEALQQVMATFLSTFNDNLSDQFTQLSTTLTRTLQWHEATQELYEQLLEELKSGVSTQTHFIHSLETVSIQQGMMQQRYDESLEEQKALVNNLTNEIRQLAGSQLQLGESLNQLSTSLTNIEDLAASFYVLEGKLAIQLEKLATIFTDALEWQAAALKSQADSHERTDALLGALTASREAQTELLESFDGAIEIQRELAKLQREQLESQQSVVDSLSETAAVFEDGHYEFTSAQRQMNEALRNNISVLNQTRAQLDTFSTETNHLLESALATLDTGTAEVTNRFSGTLINFNGRLESLDRLLDTLVGSLQRLEAAAKPSTSRPTGLAEPSSSAKPAARPTDLPNVSMGPLDLDQPTAFVKPTMPMHSVTSQSTTVDLAEPSATTASPTGED